MVAKSTIREAGNSYVVQWCKSVAMLLLLMQKLLPFGFR